MTTIRIEGCTGPLRGRLRVPGDKSISHRALLLAALAEGTSTVRGLSTGDDVRCTAAAVRAMGVEIDGDAVHGGRSRLREPEHVVDVGNSGTGIRLLAGFCSGLPWLTVLQGDASIARRPMARVVGPLRAMGARIDGREDGRFPPLVVRGGGLVGIDHPLDVASAQVKGAVLLAGLAAEGGTTVRGDVAIRAHTEELLALAGADVVSEAPHLVTTVRASALRPFEIDVPGDPSQAAFWLVAACIVPDSEVTVEHVYVGQGRADFLAVLRRMGADVEVRPTGLTTADITARHGPVLQGTTVGGEEVPGLIDEVPVLAVAAALAKGPTGFTDAAELRVKESDRVATTAAMLDSLGAWSEPRPDGIHVAGGAPLSAGLVESFGDHRIAMAGAVAALVAPGATRITGWEAVGTSYPGFEDDLRHLLGGRAVIVAIDGPAGSGKSTVAKALARALDLEYLDTGAMYRSVAFAALRHGLDPGDAEPVSRLAHQVDIRLQVDGTVCVDGVDATIEIRGPEVTRAVSAVAANPDVRVEMVRRQREWASTRGGGVVEGRDTGTVVFPDAVLKVYLTASDEERAARRAKEVTDLAYDQVAADIARRDLADSTRAASPLHLADDAVLVDTTGMGIEAVVDRVLGMLRERTGGA